MRAENEYLIEADQGHMDVIHEPCGARLLTTLHVHLDTLTRIAREHACLPDAQAPRPVWTPPTDPEADPVRRRP